MAKTDSQNNRDPLLDRAMTDAAAFGVLYDIYYEKVFKYIATRLRSKQITEDITSETFVWAAKHISKFRGIDRTDFLDWLYDAAEAQINLFLKKNPNWRNPDANGIDFILDPGHKEKLRAKTLSVFNSPEPTKLPLRLFSSMAVLILIFAGFIIWRCCSNPTPIFVQTAKIEVPSVAEADLSQEYGKSRLEKIKELADQNNAIELFKILKSDDLAARLLAAKFLAQITNSNAADFLQLAALPTEANASEQAVAPQQAKNLLVTAIDKKTGLPLVGVALEFRTNRENDVVNAQTDEKGQCFLAMPQQGANWFQISAKKQGYAPMKFNSRRSMSIPQEVIFKMPPVIEVGGIVRSELGKPLGDAEVRLRVDEIDFDMISIDTEVFFKTDANGFWRCPLFPQDAVQVSLAAKHPDYAETEKAAIVEQLESFSDVMILRKGIAVTGRVLDWENKPVTAAVARGESDFRSITDCNDEGWFKFDNVPAGTETFSVQYALAAPQIQSVTVHPNMPPMFFRLKQAGTIRARVVDIDGIAIKEVYVNVESWQNSNIINFETKTGADGFFEYPVAPDDEVIFSFSKQDYLSVPAFAMKSENDYVITLLPSFKIAGTVKSADTNEPVKIFKLVRGIYQGEATDVLWQDYMPLTFSDGKYQFVISEPGELKLKVQADGFAPAQSPIFNPEEGEANYDFLLEPAKMNISNTSVR
ncbi:MAG: hypothetical protein PHP01_07800 [Phycisphaerae bacterium]|nr:hypothetical protein [Phycisphaerae bacterium]